ncbi:MAG: caspase family protein [Actinomycetota bacterium]
MTMRAALLIGIDHYHQAAARPLTGSVTDAQEMKRLLQTHGDGEPNFDCRLLVSGHDRPAVSAQAIREELHQTLAGEADVVWIHFSGHGGIEGGGGDPGQHGVLLAQDGHPVRMGAVLDLIRASPARWKILTLDCCPDGRVGIEAHLGAEGCGAPDRCAVLAASRDRDGASSADGGRFTGLLLDGLGGGAADVLGTVTAAGLYASLDEAFPFADGRPVLKAGLTGPVELRRCKPDVERAVLRQLPTWFPGRTDVLPLDRRYEPTEPTYDPTLGPVVAGLQACARARLVEPVDAEHLYVAAMSGTGCRLTAKGRRYWRLAADGQL